MTADQTTQPLDVVAIRARVDAASPGPWLDGDPWRLAGVGFHNGPGKCAYCDRLGPPVWTGKRDINGTVMQAHRHFDPDAYASGHVIASPDGGIVVGNYNTESGGVIDPADQEFIRNARTDVPALLAAIEDAYAEIERLHELRRAAAVWRAQFEKPAKLPRMAALIAAVDALENTRPDA